MMDALGNVTTLSDTSGIPVETYRYDVFGQPSLYDPYHLPRSASFFGNPLLFTAREYLPQASLYQYRHRSFSPSLGRFLEFDPLSFSAGDPNLLRYVGNSPTNAVDPWGLIDENVVHYSKGGIRVESEVFGVGPRNNVQLNIDGVKYVLRSDTGQFVRHSDGVPLLGKTARQILDNEEIRKGIEKGIERVNKNGGCSPKWGGGMARLTALAMIGIALQGTTAANDAARYMEAVANSNTPEAMDAARGIAEYINQVPGMAEGGQGAAVFQNLQQGIPRTGY